MRPRLRLRLVPLAPLARLALALFALGCSGGPAAAPTSAAATCGPAAPVPSSLPRPSIVIAAPEGGRPEVAVGERYLAQQTGSSIAIWDLEVGSLTSVVRDVRLRGVDGAAERFFVERDGRIVFLEPSGRFGAVASDRPLTDLRPLRGGPARLLGVFHETSVVSLPVWTDERGEVENFRFSIGCEGRPILAQPYTDHAMALSADHAWAAATTTIFNLMCGELPPRMLLWSLAKPAAQARVFPLPKPLAGTLSTFVAAVREDGRRAVLANASEGGAMIVVDVPSEGSALEVVGSLADPAPGDSRRRVELLPRGRVGVFGARASYVWDLEGRREIWRQAAGSAVLTADRASVFLQKEGELAAFDVDTGKPRWSVRKSGPVVLSRGDAWVVTGAPEGGGLLVIDPATGRTRRKIASAALRAPRDLALTSDRLVSSDGATMTFWSLDRAAVAGRARFEAASLGRLDDGRVATTASTDCPDGGGARVDVWTDTSPPDKPAHRLCGVSSVDLSARLLVETTKPAEGVTGYRIRSLSGEERAALEPTRRGVEALTLSTDGRRAAAFDASTIGSDGDGTAVVTWDAERGAVLAEVGAPLTGDERRALFRGSLGSKGYVSTTIDRIALSPDGKLVAAAYRYVHMNKPNWSYETVEGEASRITVRRTDSGERALPDLDGGGDGLVFVGSDVLVAAKGRKLRAFRGEARIAEAELDGAKVTTLVASPDGRMLATGHADGVIRVWSTETLALRATLLDYRDDEWLAMTPGGAYSGTTEVAERVGWVWDAPLEPFRFEQFAPVFQRPEIVRRRLSTGEGDVGAPLVRPPRVELASAVPRSTKEPAVRVRLKVTSATRVDRVRVFAEGRQVAAASPCGDALVEVDVPLASGHNRASVVAFDDRGLASNALAFDVTRTSEAARPDLWVVAVGIDRYPGLEASAQLQFAVADARAVAGLFRAEAGPRGRFARAHVELLEDDAATPERVVGALGALADMKPDDVAVVFLAGHGLLAGPRKDMVFLTGEVRAPGGKIDRASLARGAVSWADLGRRIDAASGRVLMLVDACHAGHIDRELLAPNDDLARRLADSGRAGVVVFTAAKGRQLSYETRGARALELVKNLPEMVDAGEGHGLFTAALLKSLGDQETDRDGDGAIQLSELIDEVSWRVARSSKGAQTPWVARRELFGDFAIGDAAKRR